MLLKGFYLLRIQIFYYICNLKQRGVRVVEGASLES